MELQSVKAAELRRLAQDFRTRAAEAEPGVYRDLMLRTATELEQHADALDAKDGTEFLLVDKSDKGSET